MRTRFAAIGALVALLSTAAVAAPPPGGPGMGRPGMGMRGGPPDAAQREQFMKKIHTNFVIELGQILGLDTAGTIKLADRLQKYEDQRLPLRQENFEAMEQLRRAQQEGGQVDAAGLARKMAANRVQLAQIDQRELDDVLNGLPADKAQKVALFVAEYPHKVGRMAHMMGGGMGPGGGMGGHQGPPPGEWQ